MPLALAAIPLAVGGTLSLRNRGSFRHENYSKRIESLLVLWLKNLSGNPEHGYLADGMTECIERPSGCREGPASYLPNLLAAL